MRPVEVTKDEIIAAGNQLAEQNINITGFQLRKYIGKGTPARLYNIWVEYGHCDVDNHSNNDQQSDELNTSDLIAKTMPLIENIIESNLTPFVDAILAQQQKEHSIALGTINKQSENKITELENNLTERDEYILSIEVDNETLSAENDHKEQRIAELENSLKSATDRINEHELQEPIYRSEVAKLNRANTDLNKIVLELNNEINTEKNNNRNLSITIATSDEKIKSLTATNEENKEIINKNNNELKKLTDDINRLNIDLATHKAESSSHMNELSKERLNSADLQSRNEKLIAELATLKYKLEQHESKQKNK